MAAAEKSSGRRYDKAVIENIKGERPSGRSFVPVYSRFSFLVRK